MNLTKSHPTMRENQGSVQYPSPSLDKKQEQSIDLFLPAVVSGINAREQEFSEKTELASMSSLHAHFGLKTEVTIGTKLTVVLDIPKTFILERHLKLRISGIVSFALADSDTDGKYQVSIDLDKTYKIHPCDH